MEKPKITEKSEFKVWEYLKTCIGKKFTIENSLEYPHGVMKSGEITQVDTDYFGHVVFFNVTFSDGYVAEYANDMDVFFRYYWAQL